MKIDLRKDRRKFFYIDKRTLMPVSKTEGIRIINAMLLLQDYEKYYNKKMEDDLKETCIILTKNVVKISREDYKVFRTMDEESKKLFIECTED